MFLVIKIKKPTYEYPKHVIDKKIHAKNLIFLMWSGISSIKIYNNHII
jgi:hypothetical protein